MPPDPGQKKLSLFSRTAGNIALSESVVTTEFLSAKRVRLADM